MNLQVTEFAKFAILLGAAAFTVRRQDYMHSFSRGLGPMALVMCLVAGLISLQPDLGAIMVTVAIAMGVLFLGGLNLRIFVVVSIAVVVVVALMIYDSPWRVQRVMAYLDPWSSDYALNKAYQLSHSLIAFGRGELLGVGLGASVEKLHYLPEAHTDFILAVLGEELGFVGVTAVLLLRLCAPRLCHRAAGHQARSRFFRSCGRRRGDLDRYSGGDQCGRCNGAVADQGTDASLNELRRLVAALYACGRGSAFASGPRKPYPHARRQGLVKTLSETEIFS